MKIPPVLFTVLSASTAAAQEAELYRVPRAARAELATLKVSPQHERIEGDYVVELTAAQAAQLEDCGFRPEELLRKIQVGGPDCYSSYAEMYADFQAYAAAYPSIAELVVLGPSVQGRDLFGLRISPYFLYSLLHPNALIVSSLDFLDSAGQQTAVLTVPAGLSPTFAGLVFDHAYLLVDTVSFKASFVSKTTSLTLTP